jgi:hypothetical protein
VFLLDRTNEGNARTATYEAIATLAATAVPDQLKFVSQAGLAILSRSEKLLEMRVREDGCKESESFRG